MNPGLTPLDEALPRLLSELAVRTGQETVALYAATGRVLAEDLYAPLDVPTTDNSAMDGYAISSANLNSVPVTVAVSQRIPAGYSGEPLRAGTAARIFTGAPLPTGADAVVMQENTEQQGDSVRILKPVVAGENVRSRGEDIARDSLLFRAGHRIVERDMHTLASCGIADLAVRQPLKVAVLTTGDELVRPGTLLQPGQIYNSNFYLLSALLTRLGCQVIDCGTVGDNLEVTVDSLERAAAQADCLVSSGGVSVGEEDHVKAAVQRLGRIDLWKLAVKPGKPFAWGRVRGRPFFGLPGNPVSAYVTFVLLVRPALLAMLGATPAGPLTFRLPVDFSASSGERQEYLRVTLSGSGPKQQRLKRVDNQSSGAGSSLSRADGLAVLPPFTSVNQGDMLEFMPFSELTG
ncbi:MAG: molybdopterin molybdotransferase MoeA [Gammaproteobacteria bacterium]|nr:molybdopterin molybdotransferase MoeA [Pseudomonadales bacterium]MCP5346891.1 molybdopterin molybdotransferase MoeA [Pseudomonadales bacterium]